MVGPENSIFRKLKSVDRKKMPLTTEIILHFYFPFKAFPENERERERERAGVRGEAINGAISHRIEIAIDGERGRSEIAPSINDDKSSPTTAPLIAINGAIAISSFSRDRDRRRDLAKRRSRSWIFLSRRRSRRRDHDQRHDLAVRRFSSRARALSLSLTHFPEML